MMVIRWLLAAALMMVAAPAFAQSSAADFAERLAPLVGKPLSAGITLTSARAEGNQLRVDTLEAGADLVTGAVVTQCPPKDAQ